jgi:hypothetical protein
MDEDDDNLLTRRGLWRYFRSFLCALFTLSGATLDLPIDEATRICDDCAVWTASKMFSALPNQSAVSFEDIADWYTNGGFEVATWLELLDIGKWLPINRVDDEASESGDDESSDDGESDSDSSEEQPINGAYGSSAAEAAYEDNSEADAASGSEIFRLHLVGGKDLRLTSHDAQFIREIAVASGLYRLSPSEVVDKLRAASYQGYVARESFEEFVVSLDFHPNVSFFVYLFV